MISAKSAFKLSCASAAFALAVPAAAQDVTSSGADTGAEEGGNAILVTGSRIRRQS